ncbi:TorD/DmsD family molecular chaperone [Gordonibacter sp.]|uniref:TorD/DmsD family molecular chaperone n=1 Tax=Gordonibacter sp. TaxID=1968902 RepID=UPI002FC9D20B
MGQAGGSVAALGGITADQASYARADGALLGLLSRCLLRPSAALAVELRAGILPSTLRSLVGACSMPEMVDALDGIDEQARLLRAVSEDEARLLLEIEYNRLFVGPGEVLAPPYESYYESSRASAGRGWLRTQAEREVSRAYAESGFTLSEDLVELPDHVAVELEFLALLAGREADAWAAGNEASALALQVCAADFIVQHLGTWIESCGALVAPAARQPFYAAIFLLAGATIAGPVP